MLTETESSSIILNNLDHHDTSNDVTNIMNSALSEPTYEPEVIFDDEILATVTDNNENINSNNSQLDVPDELINQSIVQDKNDNEKINSSTTSKSTIQSTTINLINQSEQILLLDSDDEDNSEYDIIDGIMFLNFETETELNEFTVQDEKSRECNKQSNKKNVNRRKLTNKLSTNLTKSSSSSSKIQSSKYTNGTVVTNTITNHYQDLDSAFVSSELDDYLSKKSNSKLKDNLNGTTSTIGSSNSNSKQAIRSTTNRRKCQYTEDTYLNDNKFSFLDSHDSDSSIYSSSSQLKTSSIRSNSKSSQSNKSNKNKTISKRPPELLTNETVTNLNEDNNLDEAYYECCKQVRIAHELNLTKMKNQFRPVYLHQQDVIRTVLSALHPNFLQNNNEKTIEKARIQPLCKIEYEDNNNLLIDDTINKVKPIVNKMTNEQLFVNSSVNRIKSKPAETITSASQDRNKKTTLEQILSTVASSSSSSSSSSSFTSSSFKPIKKDVLFKIDPEEGKYVEKNVKIEPVVEVEKSVYRKKEYHEQGFDIARIISKHNSKRDIRLPARYNESFVGEQWYLPNFEENKNRIVNTGSSKKQTTKTNKKSSAKSPKMNANLNMDVNGDQVGNYNLNDLMTEDEDNETTIINVQDSSSIKPTISKIVNNNKVNQDELEKQRKTGILRDLYRMLYYANQPGRKEHYLTIEKKPRVNKPICIKEAIKTIQSLKEQQKSFCSANNLLVSWNNRLKLCLKELENGNFEKIQEAENELKDYRTKGMKKFEQIITTALEQCPIQSDHSNINQQLKQQKPNLTITPQQLPSQQTFNNQMNNGLVNKLDNQTVKLFSYNKNFIQSSSTTNPHILNCQPDVAFLDNSNGVSRVRNLKPKISIQHTINPSSSSIVNNNFSIKSSNPNITLTSANSISLHRSMAGNKLIKNKNLNQLNQSIKFNGSSILNKSSSISNSSKNFMHCNNVNFVSSPSNNSFVTFKFTGNGLQMPYCAPAEIVANPQPNQLNHLPQIVPNQLNQNHSLAQSSNHPPTFVNLNFLKPNEITSHPNLSITESVPNQSTTSSSQPIIMKNYAKILPKFPNTNLTSTNNVVKMTAPVSFLPNLQLIPTTHNLVISPINPSMQITSSSPTCHQVRTTLCLSKPSTSVITIQSNNSMTTNSNKTATSTKVMKVIVNGESTKNNMKTIPKFESNKEVGVNRH